MTGRASNRLLPWTLVLLIGPSFAAAAEVSVEFPLRGLYHAGQYMPVRVTADAGDASARTLTLGGRGIVPTEIQLFEGRVSTTVPLLVWGASPELHWRIDDGPPATAQVDRPLADFPSDQKLIAALGNAEGFDDFIHPHFVPMSLDASRVLSGDPSAWDTLDGLALGAAEYRALPERVLQSLVAAGTVICVRSEAPPDERWRWRQWKQYWLLDFPLTGPRGALSESAYLPVGSWTPGRPAAFRRQVVLAGVVFSIFVLAGSLLGGRRAGVAVVCVCAVGFAGAVVWARAAGGAHLAIGGVMTVAEAAAQLDRWQYLSLRGLRPVELPWRSFTRPVFANPNHAASAGVTLVVNWNGEPVGFRIAAPRGARQAMLTREVAPAAAPETEPVESPMLPLVREAYLGPGIEIVGQTEGGATDWGVIVLRRTD